MQLPFVGWKEEFDSKHTFLLLWGTCTGSICESITFQSIGERGCGLLFSPRSSAISTLVPRWAHCIVSSQFLCFRRIWDQGGLLKTMHLSLVFKCCTKDLHNSSGGRAIPQISEQKGLAWTASLSGVQLEAVAMGFFRCWLMSSLARDTWM